MVEFVENDVDAILQGLITRYESISGRKLGPADPEQLGLDSIAYQASLNLAAVNHTGNQNLLRYAAGQALEELGFKFNVYRLAAAPATTQVEYTMVVGHPGQLIPAGNRVKSEDGKVIFQTLSDTNVAPAVGSVILDVECLTPGTIGNGYTAGQINIILDPLPYVSSVANTDTTANGSDEESDEELRSRIQLASSAFSVAGPTDAYKFFAKSAHPQIVDVNVESLNPGEVQIYPLLDNGVIPDQPILDKVDAIVNADKIRPLTDTVYVIAPTKIDFSIDLELQIKKNYVSTEIVAAVKANLEGYVNQWKKNPLGKDITVQQILAYAMVPGVYHVDFNLPNADVGCDPSQFANCTGITVAVTAVYDEL